MIDFSWSSTADGLPTTFRPRGSSRFRGRGTSSGSIVRAWWSVCWRSSLVQAHSSAFAGGGRGIRIRGTLPGTVVFKTTAIDHSAIPPLKFWPEFATFEGLCGIQFHVSIKCNHRKSSNHAQASSSLHTLRSASQLVRSEARNAEHGTPCDTVYRQVFLHVSDQLTFERRRSNVAACVTVRRDPRASRRIGNRRIKRRDVDGIGPPAPTIPT